MGTVDRAAGRRISDNGVVAAGQAAGKARAHHRAGGLDVADGASIIADQAAGHVAGAGDDRARRAAVAGVRIGDSAGVAADQAADLGHSRHQAGGIGVVVNRAGIQANQAPNHAGATGTSHIATGVRRAQRGHRSAHQPAHATAANNGAGRVGTRDRTSRFTDQATCVKHAVDGAKRVGVADCPFVIADQAAGIGAFAVDHVSAGMQAAKRRVICADQAADVGHAVDARSGAAVFDDAVYKVGTDQAAAGLAADVGGRACVAHGAGVGTHHTADRDIADHGAAQHAHVFNNAIVTSGNGAKVLGGAGIVVGEGWRRHDYVRHTTCGRNLAE